MARKGTEKLLGAVAVSAVTETMKMNQKFPMTGEAFDPFQSDSQDFTLKSAKKAVPTAEPVPTGTYPRPKAEAAPREGMPSPEEGPQTAERLHVPAAAPAAPRAKSALSGLNAGSLRRAVILSEILGPPVSRRGRR